MTVSTHSYRPISPVPQAQGHPTHQLLVEVLDTLFKLLVLRLIGLTQFLEDLPRQGERECAPENETSPSKSAFPPSQGPGGLASTISPGAGTIRPPGCSDPKGRTAPTKTQIPPSLQGLPITTRRTEDRPALVRASKTGCGIRCPSLLTSHTPLEAPLHLVVKSGLITRVRGSLTCPQGSPQSSPTASVPGLEATTQEEGQKIARTQALCP